MFAARGIEIHEKAKIKGYGIFARICVSEAVENIAAALGIPLKHWKINKKKSVD